MLLLLPLVVMLLLPTQTTSCSLPVTAQVVEPLHTQTDGVDLLPRREGKVDLR